MATNLLRTDSLKSQLHQILKERILDGSYAANSQLPSESELTDEFGISRATVRSALSALETEGFIVRRWGVGTFVAEAPPIAHPISEALDFNEMIAASGFEPGVGVGRAFPVTADGTVARDLMVQEGEQVLRLEKVFTADGHPVIYVINLIPHWVLGAELAREVTRNPQITEPVYVFMEDGCGHRIDHHVATLEAQLIEEWEVPIPDKDPRAPMLVMKSIAFNGEERPIFRSLSAYPDKRVKFKLFRHRA